MSHLQVAGGAYYEFEDQDTVFPQVCAQRNF
jgi:hypothetical protein